MSLKARHFSCHDFFRKSNCRPNTEIYAQDIHHFWQWATCELPEGQFVGSV